MESMTMKCKECGEEFSDEVNIDDEGGGGGIASIRCEHCDYMHLAPLVFE